MLYGTRTALVRECPSWTLWIPLPVRTGRPDCQSPSLWHRPCFSPSATTARNAGEPHCEASCAGRRRSLRSLLLSAHWHCCRSALRWTLRPSTEVPPPFGFGVGGATPPLPIGSLGAAYRSTTPDNLNMGQFKISGCWRFVCGSPSTFQPRGRVKKYGKLRFNGVAHQVRLVSRLGNQPKCMHWS